MKTSSDCTASRGRSRSNRRSTSAWCPRPGAALGPGDADGPRQAQRLDVDEWPHRRMTLGRPARAAGIRTRSTSSLRGRCWWSTSIAGTRRRWGRCVRRRPRSRTSRRRMPGAVTIRGCAVQSAPPSSLGTSCPVASERMRKERCVQEGVGLQHRHRCARGVDQDHPAFARGRDRAKEGMDRPASARWSGTFAVRRRRRVAGCSVGRAVHPRPPGKRGRGRGSWQRPDPRPGPWRSLPPPWATGSAAVGRVPRIGGSARRRANGRGPRRSDAPPVRERTGRDGAPAPTGRRPAPRGG